MSLRSDLAKYEPPCIQNLGPAITEWGSAVDCTVITDSRRYLDFASGLMMMNCGHGDIGCVLQPFGRQGAWYTPHRARLRAYQSLESILPYYLDRFILNVTGGEAVETALKIAAEYLDAPIESFAKAPHPTYHGNHEILSHLTDGLRDGTEIHPMCRAVLLCPFEGPTCRWWSDAFIRKVREWQEETGGIVIMDECQAGMGRTGKWWGFQHYDIKPDLVVMGKALANGWPISAVAGRHEIMDAVRGDYVSTYSGQYWCCTAMRDTIDFIESRALIENAQFMGLHIKGWALAHGYQFQGKGLAMAIEVGDLAGKIIDTCLENGLILLDTRAAGTIKIAPPLTIQESELLSGLRIIDEAILSVAPGVAGKSQAE